MERAIVDEKLRALVNARNYWTPSMFIRYVDRLLDERNRLTLISQLERDIHA